MSYSTGFGTSDCAGASAAAIDYRLANDDAKSSCQKSFDLRQRIETLKPIVEGQKGLLASDTTREQVELFQVQDAYSAAQGACQSATTRKQAAYNKFKGFLEGGCYEAGGTPTPGGTPAPGGTPTPGGTSVLDAFDKLFGKRGEAKTPPVVSKTPPKYTGPRYSISQCSATPARTPSGQKGQSVFCWQRFLMAEGLSLAPYGADGDHGSITERASKEWEARQAPKPVAIVAPAKDGGGGGGGKQTTASMMPKSILGLPTNYALAGAAALLVGGAFFYMKSQETER